MRLPRLSRPSALGILVAAGAVVAASYAFAALRNDDPPAAPPPPAAIPSGSSGGISPLVPPAAGPADALPAPGSRNELDRVIGAFEDRVATRDDATDLAFLGRLYLIRARQSGDLANYEQALAALERARGIAPRYLEALGLLASARYALHDFQGAADLAAEVLAENPDDPQARTVAGDAAMALGNVDRAEEIFSALATDLPGVPAIEARLAQVAWLRGDVSTAVALAASAEERAAASGVRDADLSWYRSLRGSLAFDQGRFDVAASRFEEAREAFPASQVALGGLARVRAAQGDINGAIARYQQATAAVPDPQLLAELGDLYLLAGDPATAEDHYATVEVIGRLGAAGGAVYNRTLALFWADHDRNVAEALELTAAELEIRQDVYGWDAHAWALYRNGRFEEAREASLRARRLGTPQAEFWYHAGLISAALGDHGTAASELQRALELNPEFDPIHAAETRRVIATLEVAS